jgi:hypothetical protein
MKTNVHIVIPFDLGLELDFVGADAKAIAKEVSSRPVENLAFRGPGIYRCSCNGANL